MPEMTPDELSQFIKLLIKINANDSTHPFVSSSVPFQLYNAPVTQYYGCHFYGVPGTVPNEPKAGFPKEKPSDDQMAELLQKMKQQRDHSTRPKTVDSDFDKLPTINTISSEAPPKITRGKPVSIQLPEYPKLPSLLTNAPGAPNGGGPSSVVAFEVPKLPPPTPPPSNAGPHGAPNGGGPSSVVANYRGIQ